MSRTTFLASLFVAVLALPAAAAERQVNVLLGNTTTLSMPAPVSKITVADPGLVEVHRDGRKVVITAVGAGSTDATIVTADGVHTFHIYVASSKYGMP